MQTLADRSEQSLVSETDACNSASMGQSNTETDAAPAAEDGATATERVPTPGWVHVGADYGSRSYLAVERWGEEQ